jgi:hypothetical protein
MKEKIMVVASWQASGPGRKASSRLFLEIEEQYLGYGASFIVLRGMLRYEGTSATGQNLSSPVFGDEVSEYGEIIKKIGDRVEFLVRPCFNGAVD